MHYNNCTIRKIGIISDKMTLFKKNDDNNLISVRPLHWHSREVTSPTKIFDPGSMFAVVCAIQQHLGKYLKCVS